MAELELIATWSQVVRGARNAIDFGVRRPAGNNYEDYEDVAALLLGAKNYLGAIYRLKAEAVKVRLA